ncbi:hypothetical protein A7U60_g4722 [Sanghuangporus baumii]|uniref:ABC transporter domain-containing protein n=1 Tax=Sanghuangporus baumii TaxID=108892 RepID=A0A9Q5N4N6_SANBA|nr:hypothetical protein A7U60_g4722 [Sanghuangporus baumii]
MSAQSKHTTFQFGVWTVVVTQASFSVLSWLSQIYDYVSTSGRSRGAPSTSSTEKSKSSVEGNVEDKTGGLALLTELRTSAYLYTFLKEIFLLAPTHFIIEISLYLWNLVSGVLELYYSNRLLSLISQGLQHRHLETSSIILALACKIFITILSEFISNRGRKYTIVLRERVRFHFLEKAMHSVLNFDLMTLDDPEVISKVTKYSHGLIGQRSEAWDAFSEIMEIVTQFFTITSELSLLLSLSRHGSSFTLSILVAVMHPLIGRLTDSLSDRPFIAFCSNRHFLRMTALHRLAFYDEFRQDRISNNLGHYIEKEFKRSRKSLSDVSTEGAFGQWYDNQPVYVGVLSSLRFDCFLIIFALRVLWDFSNITLDDLILVQQTSQSVQSSLFQFLLYFERISDHLSTIRNIYSLEDIENTIKEGDTPYPLHSEGRNYSGAEIEFRNVSFRYPGGYTDALSDVSFTIKPGQLVVIVGTNGSGKTSTVKLLSRLYDPLGGEILLDGNPLPSYRLEDIRRSTAILCQDHPILPLSLRENVALGLPERDASDEEITEAIRQGGAVKFVHKLKEGLETVLHPISTIYTYGNVNEEMKAAANEAQESSDLSGGETQRLSASRTFMRLMGGNIRLLVADEPTSALDPEGEYELFKRLREHRGGKTVIFITHRFGHLTKFADLILCLKDGRLVEQGSHEMLMEADGEYKKLYDLQARGFGLD